MGGGQSTEQGQRGEDADGEKDATSGGEATQRREEEGQQMGCKQGLGRVEAEGAADPQSLRQGLEEVAGEVKPEPEGEEVGAAAAGAGCGLMQLVAGAQLEKEANPRIARLTASETGFHFSMSPVTVQRVQHRGNQVVQVEVQFASLFQDDRGLRPEVELLRGNRIRLLRPAPSPDCWKPADAALPQGNLLPLEQLKPGQRVDVWWCDLWWRAAVLKLFLEPARKPASGRAPQGAEPRLACFVGFPDLPMPSDLDELTLRIPPRPPAGRSRPGDPPCYCPMRRSMNWNRRRQRWSEAAPLPRASLKALHTRCLHDPKYAAEHALPDYLCANTPESKPAAAAAERSGKGEAQDAGHSPAAVAGAHSAPPASAAVRAGSAGGWDPPRQNGVRSAPGAEGVACSGAAGAAEEEEGGGGLQQRVNQDLLPALEAAGCRTLGQSPCASSEEVVARAEEELQQLLDTMEYGDDDDAGPRLTSSPARLPASARRAGTAGARRGSGGDASCETGGVKRGRAAQKEVPEAEASGRALRRRKTLQADGSPPQPVARPENPLPHSFREAAGDDARPQAEAASENAIHIADAPHADPVLASPSLQPAQQDIPGPAKAGADAAADAAAAGKEDGADSNGPVPPMALPPASPDVQQARGVIGPLPGSDAAAQTVPAAALVPHASASCSSDLHRVLPQGSEHEAAEKPEVGLDVEVELWDGRVSKQRIPLGTPEPHLPGLPGLPFSLSLQEDRYTLALVLGIARGRELRVRAAVLEPDRVEVRVDYSQMWSAMAAFGLTSARSLVGSAAPFVPPGDWVAQHPAAGAGSQQTALPSTTCRILFRLPVEIHGPIAPTAVRPLLEENAATRGEVPSVAPEETATALYRPPSTVAEPCSASEERYLNNAPRLQADPSHHLAGSRGLRSSLEEEAEARDERKEAETIPAEAGAGEEGADMALDSRLALTETFDGVFLISVRRQPLTLSTLPCSMTPPPNA